MAKLNIQELAEMVGWKTKNISTYVGRKKLVRGADGLFDTEDEVNKAFIEREVALKGGKSEQATPVGNEVPANIGEVAAKNNADFDNSGAVIAHLTQNAEQKSRTERRATEFIKDKLAGGAGSSGAEEEGEFGELGKGLLDYKLSDKVYKDALARKTVQQAILEELKIEKINGMLVPTGLVKPLLKNHTRSIMRSFSQVMEDMWALVALKYKIPDAELKELKKKTREKMNAGIDTAIETTKKDLGKLVDDYSMSRGKGEKK